MAHFHEVALDQLLDFMLYVIGGVMVISLLFLRSWRGESFPAIAAASAIEIEGSPAGLSAG